MNYYDRILRGSVVPTSIHATLFDKIVRNFIQYETQTAVISNGQSISYAELKRQTGLIRDELGRYGVQEGQLIGIVTRGGSQMIAAMLGIWAKRCAFVPLMTDGATARRDQSLDQIGSNVVFVDGEKDSIDGYQCINLSKVLANLSIPEDLPFPSAKPNSVAYGFFTSGSTGTPKCCLNIHSGLNNRGEAMSRIFGLKSGQAVLQNSNHIFDSSLWQIFWPLSVGAKVVIPDRTGILDFDNTLSEIEINEVVMTDFVPTILDRLMEKLCRDPKSRQMLASMKYLLVGGESVTPKLIAKVVETLPHIQLVNTYGPTEASIGMVFHHFSGGESEIPLGKPIDNTALCVVDEYLRPVPVGKIGEIVIGGACMGLGYLGNPEKTSESFIEDKCLQLGSDKIYRTGDMGHIGENGLLYFDGRADDQIKINGVRVEFGDIEHHLSNISEVQWCKVAKTTHNNHSWLVGFYTAGKDLCPQDLRSKLSEKLDAAYVPSLLVQVADVPTTPSGKVDTKALIHHYCSPEEVTSVTTLNRLEAQILTACRLVLPGRQVSVNDDLFSLGLDSLGAVTLALEVENILNDSFNLSDLLAAPSVFEISSGSWKNPNLTSTMILKEIETICDLPKVGVSTLKKEGVLLTGATGYVGRHLLQHLLRTTQHEIVCPIRCSDHNKTSLLLANLALDLDSSQTGRIKPVVTDFSISAFDVAKFGNPISVIHAAAEVNFLKGYRQLRKTNVEAVAQLCAFALEAKARFVYVSSAAVLGNGTISVDADNNLIADGDDLPLPSSGYGQSKWAAEHVVGLFRNRGLCADIFRLGEVMPDTGTPEANTRSAFVIMCRAAAQIGCVPQTEEVTNYTPISTVMQVLTRQAIGRSVGGVTVNLINPAKVTLGDMYRIVLPQLPVVPMAQFRRALQETDSDDARRSVLLLDSLDMDATTEQVNSLVFPPYLTQQDSIGLSWPDTSLASMTDMLSKLRIDMHQLIAAKQLKE